MPEQFPDKTIYHAEEKHIQTSSCDEKPIQSIHIKSR
jgi:hypothetical protein